MFTKFLTTRSRWLCVLSAVFDVFWDKMSVKSTTTKTRSRLRCHVNLTLPRTNEIIHSCTLYKINDNTVQRQIWDFYTIEMIFGYEGQGRTEWMRRRGHSVFTRIHLSHFRPVFYWANGALIQKWLIARQLKKLGNYFKAVYCILECWLTCGFSFALRSNYILYLNKFRRSNGRKEWNGGLR